MNNLFDGFPGTIILLSASALSSIGLYSEFNIPIIPSIIIGVVVFIASMIVIKKK